MTVTRDEDLPVEIGHLFQAFSRCANGYDADVVLNATVNLLVAAIGFRAKGNGHSLEQAKAFAERIGTALPSSVAKQWDRDIMPNDVTVPLTGN